MLHNEQYECTWAINIFCIFHSTVGSQKNWNNFYSITFHFIPATHFHALNLFAFPSAVTIWRIFPPHGKNLCKFLIFFRFSRVNSFFIYIIFLFSYFLSVSNSIFKIFLKLFLSTFHIWRRSSFSLLPSLFEHSFDGRIFTVQMHRPSMNMSLTLSAYIFIFNFHCDC